MPDPPPPCPPPPGTPETLSPAAPAELDGAPGVGVDPPPVAAGAADCGVVFWNFRESPLLGVREFFLTAGATDGAASG